jgi:hypothetical protein
MIDYFRNAILLDLQSGYAWPPHSRDNSYVITFTNHFQNQASGNDPLIITNLKTEIRAGRKKKHWHRYFEAGSANFTVRVCRVSGVEGGHIGRIPKRREGRRLTQ